MPGCLPQTDQVLTWGCPFHSYGQSSIPLSSGAPNTSPYSFDPLSRKQYLALEGISGMGEKSDSFNLAVHWAPLQQLL